MLPEITIALVARQDASGTTYALTNNLSAVSRQWRGRFGAVQLVDWPGDAMRPQGNDGVAGRIKQSVGSIGYVDYGFAQRLGLEDGVAGKQGRPFRPGEHRERPGRASAPRRCRAICVSFSPTPRASNLPDRDLQLDAASQGVCRSQKAAAVKEVLKWCLTEGQKASDPLGYLPLSSNIVAPATAAVDSIGPR